MNRGPRHAGLLGLVLLGWPMPGAATPSGGASRPAAELASFALVVGNNRPELPSGAVLRYADDDAVATHRLLLEAGVQSTLLTRLDADTRRLNPALAPRGVARWADLEQAVSSIAGELALARRRGQPTELLFFYSGHGDVAHGEGYIMLEDGRLTRTLLFEKVLARLPADRRHLLVDACKSYYLAFERRAGGQRSRYGRPFAFKADQGLGGPIGFVLSTSSDRESHEWERYQAGIFSYEVRAALRGAADVDRDGRVTYGELGAFLTTANAAIANPRFRPRFLVRPPGGQVGDLRQALLRWHQSPALELDQPRLGHLHVERKNGERLLDVHAARDQRLALHLPDERPLFVLSADDRTEYRLDAAAAGPVALSELAQRPAQVASKAAQGLAYEQLFTVPFGSAEVEAYRRSFAVRDALEPDGRPELLDGAPAIPRARRLARQIATWTAISAGAAAAALGISSLALYTSGQSASQQTRERYNSALSVLNPTAIACVALAGGAGLTWLGLKLWPGRGHGAQLVVAPAPSGLLLAGRWR